MDLPVTKVGSSFQRIHGRVAIFRVVVKALPGTDILAAMADALHGRFSIEYWEQGTGFTFSEGNFFWASTNWDPFLYVRRGYVHAIRIDTPNTQGFDVGVDYLFPLILSVVSAVVFGTLLTVFGNTEPIFIVSLLILFMAGTGVMLRLFPFKLVRSAANQSNVG